MSLLGDISVRIGLDVADFQNGLQTAEKNMQNVGKNISNVGKTLATRVTVPLVGLGVGAVKVGADFEQSFAKVQAVTGASAEGLADMEAEARRLGKTSRFSANEIADGMGFLGMAGFKTNEILESTEDVLNLASLSGMDLATTADIASNMLSGMGMDASELGVIVDSMAYATSKSNTDVMGLGEAFKYVAPTAADLGVDLSELTASIGFLGDAGMQGGQAGRMLANGLTRLASNKGAKKMMDELNISAFDANGELLPMVDIIKNLENGLDDLNPEERAHAMAVLFGQENAKGWSTLIARGSDELERFTGEIDNAEGAGAKMSDIMNDTLYGSLDALKSILSEVGIQFFKSIQEPLSKIVNKLIKAVEWFDGLDDSIKNIVIISAGVAAVLPLLILGLGFVITTISKLIMIVRTVINVFKTIRKVFIAVRTAMAVISGPVGWIILAITTLISVGIALYKNWDTVSAYAKKIWGNLKEFFSKTFKSISGYVKDFKDKVVAWLSETWDSAIAGIKSFLSAVGNWFSDTWNSVKESTVKILTSVIEWIANWGKKIYKATGLEATVNLLISVWEFFRDLIQITTEMIVQIIVAIFKKLVSLVMPHVNKVVGAITDAWNFLAKITTSAFKYVEDKVVELRNKISKTWKAVKTVTFNTFDAIRKKLSDVWQSILSVVVPIVQNLWNSIKKIWDAVKTVTSETYESIKTTLLTIWDSMKTGVTEKAQEILTAVKDKFQEVKEAIWKPVEEAKELVWGIVEKIKGFFSNMKLSIPKPSLPNIPTPTISRGTANFLGQSITVPKISWNAKGNIFTGASLLGGGQGVGEAGAEAVMPIQHKRYMRPYAQTVADLLHEMKDDGRDSDAKVVNQFNISSLVVREEADVRKIAEELEDIQTRHNRARGKLRFT